ncbi:DUF2254 domain-containing protein [Kordia algicida OT-1]|uniref:DUF2254 domain-containing protein n=1 Tax=Kordia algicida OT-1 TaxID=391587 RepID=A9DNU1_9FLAO|nr:DUF2254 domain-containing protein [Kordia algicida]EDP97277.1 hypothetical protein KAOT1_18982 [Kordia algicida OT-1]
MLNLEYLFRKVRDSFWFVPTLIIFMSILMAIFLLYMDKTYPFTPEGIFKIIFSENSESGRNVLTVIAGSMVGIAGTVFSITIVVLQLASSQFGPRLLQNFMYKRLNQVVLGQYVGVFLYCIIVINATRDNDSYAFIPNLSILFALLLAIFNVFLLVIFIHSISMSIQPSKIINELRIRIEGNIETMYPQQVEKDVILATEEKDYTSNLTRIKQIKVTSSGYVQYFDLDLLVKKAREHEVIIKVLLKPGKYVVKEQAVFDIFQQSNSENTQLDDDFSLKESFKIATKKTFFQDVEFGIHQIVEIASKALSPGVNNPYTAVICIDNLTSVLCKLVRIDMPDSAMKDDDDMTRVIVVNDSFEGFLEAAFNLIRQYGKTSPYIIIRLMEALTVILEFDTSQKHTKTLEEYAEIVMQTGKKSFLLETDMNDLRDRYTVFKTSIR